MRRGRGDYLRLISRDTPILLDANAIAACHEFACWRAIAGAFRLETVEECIKEFQTGGYALQSQEYVDERTLRGQFRHVHNPTELELAEVLLDGGAGIHCGEQHLWAHALGREDAWVLCGPDRGSMRFGCHRNHGQRLIALGSLLDSLRHPSAGRLPHHYTQNWLEKVRRDFILGIV